MSDYAENVSALSVKFRDRILDILKHSHMYPEVSQKEYETTNYIKDIMLGLGIDLCGDQPETGAVFLMKGRKPGPCVGLRADIDALPIKEQSSCGYPSLNEGVMHACGHDAHFSSLLGAAMILNEMKDDIPGSIKFIFQPAEEINMGAKKLIPAGVLEHPHVEAIYSFHTSSDIPTGSVAVIHGPIMASVDDIIINIKGKGGHGGIPHRSTDPVIASAAVIMGLQTIVSRNTKPTDSAVVTISSVIAGAENVKNIIPDEVKLYGTIRAYKEETRNMIRERVQSICKYTSEAYGCDADIRIIEHLPVTDNRPADSKDDLYDIAIKSVESIDATAVTAEPSGGGDDFSLYLKGVDGHPGTSGFFYWVGIRNEEKDCVYPWHSPKYKVDPEAVIIGAKLLAMSALNTFEQCNSIAD